MPSINPEAVLAPTIACSFILLGNAITQSFMSVPALLVDFPHPTSPSYAQAARHLGRQWPTFWHVGNVFFRPISTLGIFGYAYVSYAAYLRAASLSSSLSSSSLLSAAGGVVAGENNTFVVGNWKLFALSAICHLVTVIHSAINLQPINAKIDALRGENDNGRTAAAADVKVVTTDPSLAEWYARRWIRLNLVRAVMPAVAGGVALWQGLRGRF